MNKKLSILILLFLIAVLPIALILTKQRQEIRKKAATNDINVYLNANTVSPNGTTSGGVIVTVGTPVVDTATVHITYDSSKITLSNLRCGDGLDRQFIDVATPGNYVIRCFKLGLPAGPKAFALFDVAAGATVGDYAISLGQNTQLVSNSSVVTGNKVPATLHVSTTAVPVSFSFGASSGTVKLIPGSTPITTAKLVFTYDASKITISGLVCDTNNFPSQSGLNMTSGKAEIICSSQTGVSGTASKNIASFNIVVSSGATGNVEINFSTAIGNSRLSKADSTEVPAQFINGTFQITGGGTTKTCSAGAFTDNFDAASLDTTKWNVGLKPTGVYSTGTVTQSGGKLNMNTPVYVTTTGVFPANDANVYSKNLISGDFVAETTVNNLNAGSGNAASAELAIDNLARTEGIHLAWRKPIDGRSFVNLCSPNCISDTNVPLNTTNLKLKLERVGSTARGYIDTGSGYQLVATATNVFSGDGTVMMLAYNFPESTAPITASFDNFSLGCPAGTPTATPEAFTITGLTHTINPAGLSLPTPNVRVSFDTSVTSVASMVLKLPNGDIMGPVGAYNMADFGFPSSPPNRNYIGDDTHFKHTTSATHHDFNVGDLINGTYYYKVYATVGSTVKTLPYGEFVITTAPSPTPTATVDPNRPGVFSLEPASTTVGTNPVLVEIKLNSGSKKVTSAQAVILVDQKLSVVDANGNAVTEIVPGNTSLSNVITNNYSSGRIFYSAGKASQSAVSATINGTLAKFYVKTSQTSGTATLSFKTGSTPDDSAVLDENAVYILGRAEAVTLNLGSGCTQGNSIIAGALTTDSSGRYHVPLTLCANPAPALTVGTETASYLLKVIGASDTATAADLKSYLADRENCSDDLPTGGKVYCPTSFPANGSIDYIFNPGATGARKLWAIYHNDAAHSAASYWGIANSSWSNPVSTGVINIPVSGNTFTFKLKFVNINTKPTTPNVTGLDYVHEKARVIIKSGDNELLKKDDVVLTAGDNGIYTSAPVNLGSLASGTYKLYVKPVGYFQKRFKDIAFPPGGVLDLTAGSYKFEAGDSNNDGVINLVDVNIVISAIQKQAAGTLTANDYNQSDYDRNGIINSGDTAVVFETMKIRYDDE